MSRQELTNVRLQYARWEDLPDGDQGVFTSMMGGDPQRGREFYQLYFYWYNIAHEVGHVLRTMYGRWTGNNWEEENAVNQLAVAYWRAKGETERLMTLETTLRRALSNLPDPVPPHEDRATYLNQHLQEVSNNPAAYAHYQFNMVLAALTHPLEFSTALRQWISPDANDGTTIPLSPDYPLDEELPHRTVYDLRKTMTAYSLYLPDIQIACLYSPALQFVIWV